MYFVDKEKLTQKLTYLQGLTEDYDKNKENHYAYERIAQMLIESSVDIGNMIIDGFILRDPGNYKDVIDILELENVISKETQTHINDTVDVRKQFAHNYTELNVKKSCLYLINHCHIIRNLSKRLHNFLKVRTFQLLHLERGEPIVKNYKAYLIDLDGTMYKGTDEIDGAAQL